MQRINGPKAADLAAPGATYSSADPYGGTTADNGKPIWTLDHVVANLHRTGQDWTNHQENGELSNGVLTYSFWTSLDQLQHSYYVNDSGTIAFNEAYYGQYFSAFTPDQMAMARQTITLWDDLINVHFQEIADPNQADITYGNTYTGGAQAYAYLPFGNRFDAYHALGFSHVDKLGGDVWVDGFVPSNFFPVGDSWYSMMTMIHETGHALGLSHPGSYDAAIGPATYDHDAQFYQDSRQYTVMSYFDSYYTGAQTIDWNLLSFGYGSTPLVHDVAAIQAIYGADMTTRTGDTTYGFNSNADRSAFDFTENRVPVVTIWDAGGNDTLDLSGYNTPSTIDLHEGAFSSAGGIDHFLTLAEVNANRAAAGLAPRTQAAFDFYEALKAQYHITDGLFHDNISIAYGAKIENAIGGGGNDTITGNALNNVLKGNGGNDRISGDDGIDTITLGAGNDTFVAEVTATKTAFKGPAKGNMSWDIVTDFTTGQDHIDVSGLSNMAFKGTAATKGNDLTYKVFDSVTGAENALGIDIHDQHGASGIGGPVTVVFGNVNGGGADFAIILLNHSGVTSSDFIFHS